MKRFILFLAFALAAQIPTAAALADEKRPCDHPSGTGTFTDEVLWDGHYYKCVNGSVIML